MIEPNQAKKHYASAHRRFLVPMLAKLLERELSRFGPELAGLLAERIVELFDQYVPPISRLEHGQILWCALDRQTRAGSRNERIKPVVLTIVAPEDALRLAKGEKPAVVKNTVVKRMFEEAAEQGSLLSTRDLAMIFQVSDSRASCLRTQAEEANGGPLPHPGILHDMGSTITHKVDIIRKVVCQKMDSAHVARATHHTQRAVDNYIQSYNRVQLLYDLQPDIPFIREVTGMSERLIKEYINIIQSIENHENENDIPDR